jgi:predicted DCC family thiol-disulfide oxidoreductase YuxK
MRKLTVYSDERCEFCRECRRWLESEPKLIPLEFAPRQRLKEVEGLADASTSSLVVIDDEGGVYLGPKAFIIWLYALREYRNMSAWLSRPGMAPLAAGAFTALSKGRGAISAFLKATS